MIRKNMYGRRINEAKDYEYVADKLTRQLDEILKDVTNTSRILSSCQKEIKDLSFDFEDTISDIDAKSRRAGVTYYENLIYDLLDQIKNIQGEVYKFSGTISTSLDKD